MHKRQSIARGRDTYLCRLLAAERELRAAQPTCATSRDEAHLSAGARVATDARALDVLVVIHRLHRRTADPQAKSECAEGLCTLVQYYHSFQLPTTNECFQKNQIACGRRVTLMRAYFHGDSADARPLVICT